MSNFSDDAPKIDPSDDKLNVKAFSERLARSIIDIQAPNGYVVGLQGEWGSGKSTVLNFIQALIKNHNENESVDRTLNVVDFRPWIVSGHQDLIEAFFKVLTEQLADRSDAWKFRGKGVLKVIKSNADPLIDAVATVGAVVAPGLSTIAGSAVKGIAKHTLSDKLDSWLSDPSLQSAYDNLRAKIATNGGRYLVVIDDIDRLSSAEVRSIMQMVKTVGRLPNVIYLLAYDKRIVWPALSVETDNSTAGPAYAEKIVQQEIELPRPKRSALLGMLDSEIEFMTGGVPNDARWQSIVRDGIHRWVRNPRDVARLSNALKFTWPALKGDVDPVDVLAIEGIRLFEPVAFAWIRNNRDIIFSVGRFSFEIDNSSQSIMDEVHGLTEKRDSDRLVSLILILLPSLVKAFKGHKSFGSELEPFYKTKNRRGIGSEVGCDSYFSFYPTPDAVPLRFIRAALSLSTDSKAQNNIIDQMLLTKDENDRPLIGDYFQDLNYMLEEHRDENLPASLLEALFVIGTKLQGEDFSEAVFSLSPQTNLHFLIHKYCKIYGPRRLIPLLDKLFNNDDLISYCVEFWVDRARDNRLIPQNGRSDNPVIDTNALNDLHGAIKNKVEQLIDTVWLDKLPFYYHLFELLSYPNNHEQVKEIIALKSISSASFTAKVARGLLSYTVGSNPKIYHMHSAPDRPYYDIKDLYTAANKHYLDSKLSADEKNRIDAMRNGLGLLITKNAASEQGG